MVSYHKCMNDCGFEFERQWLLTAGDGSCQEGGDHTIGIDYMIESASDSILTIRTDCGMCGAEFTANFTLTSESVKKT